ncbi:hypothetical protein [Pararhodonellum marinum]|uniref:hypothetical protein n=1 Tax=Pararhodonellum marinum TaxID=2755358 RepID=UPI00188EAE39|nr:hypothetical protein [Pararhodonellum marinum]
MLCNNPHQKGNGPIPSSFGLPPRINSVGVFENFNLQSGVSPAMVSTSMRYVDELSMAKHF